MLETEAAGKSARRRGTSPASAAEVYPGAPWMVDPVVSRGEKKHSQSFTYDQLNRLTGNTRRGAANQSWTLDTDYVLLRQEPKFRLSEGAAYWETSFTSNGTTQTRTANAQNQITSISGTTGTPTYDANGNMTTDQSGNTYVYNAWNQLVAVKNSTGAVIAQYTYDARGYRITESYLQGGTGIPAGTTNYIYYDSQWQAIETRTNGTANSNVTSQTVWSAAYVNAAVLRDSYGGGVAEPLERIYFQQDANWNTTATVGFINATWQVTQRYAYSPYGSITVLNPDWSTPAVGTQPIVNNLYQGMTLDPVTGLYYARNRNYSPSLGRWINQDPLQYINGANTYQFVMGNPVGNVDPNGKTTCGPCAAVAAAAANLLGAQSAYDQAQQRLGQDEAAVRADTQALPALKNALKAAVAAESSARTEELLVSALLQSAIAEAYAHPNNWGYEMDKIIVENKFNKARTQFHADEARTRAAQANLAGDQAAMSAAQAALTADKSALAAANYRLANAEARYINALAKCHQ